MPGNVTISATEQAQGEISVDVSNNGGSTEYQTGPNSAINNTGGSIQEGDVGIVTWDSSESTLSVDSLGSRGSGTVSSRGTSITVSNEGNTDLEGTVEIDLTGEYGSNSGYAGETVPFGAVDGKSAYLK